MPNRVRFIPDPKTCLKQGPGSTRSNFEESRQQLGLLQVAGIVSNLLADLLELLEGVVRVARLTTHWSWGCIHLKDTWKVNILRGFHFKTCKLGLPRILN